MTSKSLGNAGAVGFADDARMVPGYEIVREIARGGSGRVYEVRAPGGIAKAAKVVRLDPDDPLTEREVEGLRLIRSVRHPYLVSIDRVDVESDHITLVMELADCSLREMQTEFRASGANGIPRERLVPWLVEAAEALDVLNFKYLVRHLDVKPENMFLFAEHLKVGDYGLAREAGRNVIDPNANAVTPAYAAPELLDSQVSASSDQYSLAVVYMEMLTGALPFRTTDLRQLALYHLTRQPDLSALPVAERPVVARALARDPSRRFRSCLEFIEAIVDAEAARPRTRPPSNAETIRMAGATVRVVTGRGLGSARSLAGPTSAFTAISDGPARTQSRCLTTSAPPEAVRAAVKRLAEASMAEWFDFGEMLVAYRLRDAAGSLLVGVRSSRPAADGPTQVEANITRHGQSQAEEEFSQQAEAVFAALQESLAARPDAMICRRAPRVQVQWPVTLFPLTGPMRGVPLPCTAINASARGLGAVSAVPIDAQAVHVRPANHAESLPARVVYCRPSTGETSFLVGLELVEEMNPDWFETSAAAADPAGP